MKHECLSSRVVRYQRYVDDYGDAEIHHILETHNRPDWLKEHKPETKPGVRLYMRLVRREAQRRGLL